MSMPRVLAAVTAATIALGSFGVGSTVASAAMMNKPSHHGLVCKKGYVAHKVKVHGKWKWTCHRLHHHHMMMNAPMSGAPKAPMGGGGGKKY
jgi:hypothetical protein